MPLNRLIHILAGSSLVILSYTWVLLADNLQSIGVVVLTVTLPILWRPRYLWCMLSFVYAFHFLYVAVPGILNYIYYFLDFNYILPWGQFVFWEKMYRATVIHIVNSFLILTLLSIALERYFNLGGQDLRRVNSVHNISKKVYLMKNKFLLYSGISILLSVFTMLAIAPPSTWMSSYSSTFLMKREGFGELLILGKAVTDVSIFGLGFLFFRTRSKIFIFIALLVICSNGFLNGFKSRMIILIILFVLPFIITLRFKIFSLARYFFVFLGFLYLLTLVRTDGFYAGFFFVEMLIGYFNAFSLHDLLLSETRIFDRFTLFDGFSRWNPFGAVNMPKDLSIELTKIYFPDQWYTSSATQQWPLVTELYINFGHWSLWVLPLAIYLSIIAVLLQYSFHKSSPVAMLIMFMEGFRIISTLRGVLIPWTLLFTLLSYAIYSVLMIKFHIKTPND